MNMWVRDYAVSSASDFLQESSFWLPEQIPTSAWLGHAPFAFWLMSVLKPRSVVELGVHSGFSYLAFCQAVQSLQLECSCSGVDTWQGDEHAGFYGDEIYDRLTASHQRYAGFSRLIRSTFDAALSDFADGSVDLLHIDGRHHYDDVHSDFESWKSKLSDRAIVLFHDTNVPEFGVGRLWADLCDDHPHFTFMHSHGLGVLGYGSDVPLKLRQLFLTSDMPGTADSVRMAYQRLGNSIADGARILNLEGQLIAQTQSTSWRITRPIRVFFNWARNVAALVRNASV